MNSDYLKGKEDGLATAEAILLTYSKPDPTVVATAVVLGREPDTNDPLVSAKCDIIKEINKVVNHEDYEVEL